MIDLEAVEKLQEAVDSAVSRLEGVLKALTDVEEEKEFFAKGNIEALIKAIEEADTEEKKDKALKDALAFLKKLMEYYPYPSATANTSDERVDEKEENTDEESNTEESSEEISNLEAELDALKKENEELKAELEKIAAEKLFQSRVTKLQEIDKDKAWDKLRDLILKMSDEEFEVFVNSLSKENHSVVPEKHQTTKSPFSSLKEDLKEVNFK